MADKPEFLNNPAASTGAAKEPFESPAQKSGGMEPDGGNANDKFPNRPQKSGGSDANPQSKVPGGPLPFKGPPADPGKPFKLGGS